MDNNFEITKHHLISNNRFSSQLCLKPLYQQKLYPKNVDLQLGSSVAMATVKINHSHHFKSPHSKNVN